MFGQGAMSRDKWKGILMRDFEFVESTDGTIELDVYAGADIGNACRQMVAIANRRQKTVKAKFNDIELVAEPGVTGESLIEKHRSDVEKRSEEYRNSPKGKAAKAEMDARITFAQERMWKLIERLPFIENESALMDWCAEYADHGDMIGVDRQSDLVIRMLERFAGRNEHVGATPEWLQEQPTRMAKYIVGQVINCLAAGMPAHPMTISFVEQYREKCGKAGV